MTRAAKEWLKDVLCLWGPELTIPWLSLANILNTETFKSTIHFSSLLGQSSSQKMRVVIWAQVTKCFLPLLKRLFHVMIITFNANLRKFALEERVEYRCLTVIVKRLPTKLLQLTETSQPRDLSIKKGQKVKIPFL